jgi:hypothetical protein
MPGRAEHGDVGQAAIVDSLDGLRLGGDLGRGCRLGDRLGAGFARGL